jgi:hypothetical protein
MCLGSGNSVVTIDIILDKLLMVGHAVVAAAVTAATPATASALDSTFAIVLMMMTMIVMILLIRNEPVRQYQPIRPVILSIVNLPSNHCLVWVALPRGPFEP